MSEKMEQAEAKYKELVDAVEALTEKMAEFRKITFEFDCVDFDEIDDQMIEENL